METIAEAGRVLLSLALVLGLMWGLARFVRRSPRTRDTNIMDVLARQQLTKNSTLTVVRVLDQALLLGVTDGQVSLLGEVDLDEAQERLEAGQSGYGALAGIANRAEKTVAAKVMPAARRVGSKFGLAATAPKPAEFADDLDDAVTGYEYEYPEIVDGYDIESGDTFTGGSADDFAADALNYDEIDAATDGAANDESHAPRSAGKTKPSPLAGSALSPATWRQTVDVLRGASSRGQ